MTILDFEKPIGELLEQIDKMKVVAEKSGVDVSKTIKDLEDKLSEKRKEIYGNLTPGSVFNYHVILIDLIL